MTPVTVLNPSPAEPDTPTFENNVDPDQLVSKNPADQDNSVFHSVCSFIVIKGVGGGGGASTSSS